MAQATPWNVSETTFWQQPRSFNSTVYASPPETSGWRGGGGSICGRRAFSSPGSSSLPTQPTVSSAMPSMGLHSQHNETQREFAPLSIAIGQAMTVYF